MTLAVGQVYKSLEEAKLAVLDWVVERGESYSVKKAKSKIWLAVCRADNCDFHIRISMQKTGEAVLTVLKLHQCSPLTHMNWKPAHSVEFLQERHRAVIVDNREIQPKQLQATERLQYGNAISYRQAHRVHEAIRQETEGNEADTFNLFSGLVNKLIEVDPKGIFNLGVIAGTNQFSRILVIPGALRWAALHCRPMICFDACHTKTRFPLILLMASTFDGNGNGLPIGYGLVLTEDYDNWFWFLEHFAEAHAEWIERSGDQLVVISDRDKGLLRAVEEAIPTAAHSYCCKHLSANLQNMVHDSEATQFFWSCAKAITEEQFLTAMQRLQEQSEAAHDYINGIEHKDWATYVFP
jgi:hypothetical protein